MRRREFIAGLGGATVWPFAARAQEVKRLGLLGGTESDPGQQSLLSLLTEGLRKLGWIASQNLRIEVRWSGVDRNLRSAYARDLVDLFKPDVLLCSSTANLIALQRATETIPIVFINVADPVKQGFVSNLARPGGNITGFANLEVSVASKWIDLLKKMVPSIARVAFLFNPETSPQDRLFVTAAADAGQLLGVEVTMAEWKTPEEIEATLMRLAHQSNVGLIFPPDIFSFSHAKTIVDAVERYRLPAMYAGEEFVSNGGLMQYHRDLTEVYRKVPFYIDRILRGTKPGDLPIELPTRFRFTINRKTASALGIDVPLGLLLAADEVIQ
jgi:putative ABC transport system substrate-binding protein